MAINGFARCRVAATVAAMLLVAGEGLAQTRTSWIGTAGVELSYKQGDAGGGEGTNWLSASSENFQPDRNFGGIGEFGSISNGGIALIDQAITVSPTDIILGETTGTAGTLRIRNGGSINILEAAGGQGSGALRNGAPGGGIGTLVLRDNIGSVSLQNYSQNSISTLVAQLGGHPSFANPVQVSQQISIDGTLRVERTPGSVFVPSAGNSWTLFQGAPVTGSFDAIEVDPVFITNPGRVFAVSTAGNAVTVSVEQRLVLQVNRFTGATTLRNPTGHSTSIELISYTLSSATTTLDSTDSRWKSFDDDPTKPGWFEAPPIPSNLALSELNPESSLTMAVGAMHDLGTPFNANTNAPLGTNRVNANGAAFNYQRPDGSLVPAVLEVVGRFNDLVLVVDPVDGSAVIQNQSSQSIDLISYTISATTPSLLTNFSGLEGLDEPDWFKANPQPTNLSELSAGDPLELGVGEQRDLGFVWNTAGGDDLSFAYQDPIGGNLVDGTVHFGVPESISTALDGDHNGDGTVDIVDYVFWRANSEIETGYTLWSSNFGDSQEGSGGGLASGNAAVPEPVAGLLLAVGAATFALNRRLGIRRA